MHISIIIPVLNEALHIQKLLTHLAACNGQHVKEIMVIDGGSTDHTREVVQQMGVRLYGTAKPGRAQQMNEGAAHAQGDILYFVHADTLPPKTFAEDILQAVTSGHAIGCYRMKFDTGKLMLRVNGYCSRFKRLMCRGGDQTLFVTKELFQQLRGFDTYYVVMEEYDFIRRAQQAANFKVIPKEAVVSARKYEHNSYLRVNVANLIVFSMFRLGYSPMLLRDTYHRLIRRQR